MSAPRRCVVLVPFLTHVEPACDKALRGLEANGYTVRRYSSGAAIDQARSLMATRALADGFDELLWIDSDMVFEPTSVDRLREHELPLVGGLYAKRGVREFACTFRPDTAGVTVGTGGGLLDVDHVGTGFLLTRRAVYDDVQSFYSLPICNAQFGAALVPYFLPMVIAEPAGHRYLPEDYAFCQRARAAGHRVVVDTTIRLGHLGTYEYRWEDVGMELPRSETGTVAFERKKRDA